MRYANMVWLFLNAVKFVSESVNRYTEGECFMKRFAAILLLFTIPLLAQSNGFQVVHEPPDTTVRFDPETGLPVGEETKLDTILRFDPETGLPLSKPSIQPQQLPTSPEPGAGESRPLGQVADEKLKHFQIIVGGAKGGWNLALSSDFPRRFVKRIELSGYRHLESFYLYPTLTLGFLGLAGDFKDGTEVLYGIIEGHGRWEMENLRPSVFLGVGLGEYQDYVEGGQGGKGLVLSAGVQLESRRRMGGLHLYRTPGLGRLVTIVNVGYRPKSYKEGLTIAAVGACMSLLIAIIAIMLFTGAS